MFSLVLHALRARRSQALAMLALAVLAGLGSAAAPWFLGWGSDSVARSSVAAAPDTERLVYGAGSAGYDPSAPNPLDVLRNAIEAHLPVAGSEITVGASLYVTANPVPNQGTSVPPSDDDEPGNDEPRTDEPGDEPETTGPATSPEPTRPARRSRTRRSRTRSRRGAAPGSRISTWSPVRTSASTCASSRAAAPTARRAWPWPPMWRTGSASVWATR